MMAMTGMPAMMPGMGQSMPGMDGMMGAMMMPGAPPPPPGGVPAPGMETSLAVPGVPGMDVSGMNPMMQMPGMMPGMNPMMMGGGGMQSPGMMPPGMMQMMMTPNGPMMMMAPGGMQAPGMNPMMMGMNPMMMGMNPMMMGGQMPQAEFGQVQAQAEEEAPEEEPEVKQPSLRERLGIGPRSRPARDLVWGKNETDPQVADLCKQFQIEDRIRDRLNDVMMTREGTYDEDMKALWEVCETAKKPSGFLMVKISELERGVFTGAAKSDNDLQVFVQKHRLDDRCLAKLIEVFATRQDSKREEIREIERVMRASDRPQAQVMPLLEHIKKMGRLPSPQRKDKRKKKSSSESRSRSRSKSRKRR